MRRVPSLAGVSVPMTGWENTIRTKLVYVYLYSPLRYLEITVVGSKLGQHWRAIKRKTSHRQHEQPNEDIPGTEGAKIYTYKELRNATDDFSPANKVGEGGFGSVYKGRLRDGKFVAVKVLSSESKQGAREFLTEITVISGIIHENLVKLYGCCVEGTHRILVYNYCENNSLAQTLLGSSRSSIQLNWRTRAKICVAKLLPANVTHVSTKVAGTIGYLAPEYAVRGQVTRKSDVYSYGVLLLEIVSGRCNTNTRLPYEDQFLLERSPGITSGLLILQTWDLYECGKLANIIDNSLTDDLDIEEACKFLKIGLLCTQDTMKLRPSMSNVVKMLTGKKDVDSEITKPGIIDDFMELKIRSMNKAADPMSSSGISPALGKSPLSSVNTTYASMTFTSIFERD
ncbi:hypothetical protein OPV22_015046 [Ensete ventricosum]|uniref:Protein kinase domain-containing protein n=1 Tax=Ensete ventricosum TaxID=4639 RepID=A0AAV8R8Z1_ENSVE|nr:hypothetical protein OPV22_015046 [Ensete ventricosum]